MSNLPPGVSWYDPHFGAEWEDEILHECKACGLVVDGIVEQSAGVVTFWHRTEGSDIHQDDITDEWYPGRGD